MSFNFPMPSAQPNLSFTPPPGFLQQQPQPLFQPQGPPLLGGPTMNLAPPKPLTMPVNTIQGPAPPPGSFSPFQNPLAQAAPAPAWTGGFGSYAPPALQLPAPALPTLPGWQQPPSSISYQPQPQPGFMPELGQFASVSQVVATGVGTLTTNAPPQGPTFTQSYGLPQSYGETQSYGLPQSTVITQPTTTTTSYYPAAAAALPTTAVVSENTPFKGRVFSMVSDTQVTLCPYFEVHNMQGFMEHAMRCTELAKQESTCNYYGFTFCGNAALCRESYTSAEGVLTHLHNIDVPFCEGLLTCGSLVRMEVHGPRAELEKLKGPMQELSPDFYELMEGGFLVKETSTPEGPISRAPTVATATAVAAGQTVSYAPYASQGAAYTVLADPQAYTVPQQPYASYFGASPTQALDCGTAPAYMYNVAAEPVPDGVLAVSAVPNANNYYTPVETLKQAYGA